MVEKTTTGGEDIGQALLELGFMKPSQIAEVDKEVKVSGLSFGVVAVNKRYISETTLGNVKRFLNKKEMTDDDYANLVTVNPVGTAAQREVATLVVKNLIAAAKKDGCSWIYLIPVPGGRTEVFFVNAEGTTMSFFVTLSAPPFSELTGAFKVAEQAKKMEAIIRVKI